MIGLTIRKQHSPGTVIVLTAAFVAAAQHLTGRVETDALVGAAATYLALKGYDWLFPSALISPSAPDRPEPPARPGPTAIGRHLF